MSSLDNSIRQINPIHAAILMVLAQFTGWCAPETAAQQPLRSAVHDGEKKHAVRRERHSRSV